MKRAKLTADKARQETISIVPEEAALSDVLTNMEYLACAQAECLERFKSMLAPERLEHLERMETAQDDEAGAKLAVAST